MQKRMEGSSPWHEEERTATFYMYHPCYFLQEALRSLLRCLGIESGTSMSSQAKQERSSLPHTHAAAEPIINSPTNTNRTSLDAADPQSVTDHTMSTRSIISRRGSSRRSTISHGSGPQHN